MTFQYMAESVIAISNGTIKVFRLMVEESPLTSASKQPGWFRGALGRATAVIGGLTALVVALVALVNSFDELAAALRRTVAGFGREAPASSPALVPTKPRQAPETTPVENAPTPRRPTAEHAARTLFIITPPGSDGALIDTRARRVFEQEGFAPVGDRAAASVTVEIAPPSFGPARTLPNSGLEITSMAATLQATIIPRAEGAPVSPQQREVVGRGDGEEAARRDAMSRAADQLSERIAAVLRQSVDGGGTRP